MFVSVAAIQMFVYYKIINVLYFRKYIDNIPLFIYLSLVTSNFYLSMFNALRSSIASLFIFLSILILLENKKLKSFLLILAGACFHPSVIIWTPIIFIRKIFYKKMKLRFLIFIILCFVLNHLNFIPNTAKFIYDTGIDIPYRNYLISYHMFPYTKTLGIATIINMLIFIFSLFAIYEKEYDKNKIYIYNLGYISFSLLLLFANIPIFTRLLEPSVLFRNYIIYKLIKKTCRKKYLYLGIFFILYFFMTFVRMSLGQIAAS